MMKGITRSVYDVIDLESWAEWSECRQREQSSMKVYGPGFTKETKSEATVALYILYVLNTWTEGTGKNES
jgi:hypothetical protein